MATSDKTTSSKFTDADIIAAAKAATQLELSKPNQEACARQVIANYDSLGLIEAYKKARRGASNLSEEVKMFTAELKVARDERLKDEAAKPVAKPDESAEEPKEKDEEPSRFQPLFDWLKKRRGIFGPMILSGVMLFLLTVLPFLAIPGWALTLLWFVFLATFASLIAKPRRILAPLTATFFVLVFVGTIVFTAFSTDNMTVGNGPLQRDEPVPTLTTFEDED